MPPTRNPLIIYGTANPIGLDHKNYNGVFLTDQELRNIVRSKELIGKPVWLEHHNDPIVGKVQHAWVNDVGKLDVLLCLDENFGGWIAGSFLRDGLIKELSLGYDTELTRMPDGKLVAGKKHFKEISLCKTGARPGTQIHCHSVPEHASKKARTK